MSKLSRNQISEDEISLRDIIEFLLGSWKTIITTAVLGICCAAIYVMVIPSQYEATAQIRLAQIRVNYYNNNQAMNVEEPNLLVFRLKLPNSYSVEDIKACGFQDDKFSTESLLKATKLSLVNGVNSIVELKIRMSSKELAISCATALFENIRRSQNDLIKPQVEQSKILLANYQVRLQKIKSLLQRYDDKSVALNVVYLTYHDEVKFLTDEIIRINAFITASDLGQAKLLTPIYSSDGPVFPNKKNSLVIGLLVGLFLGVMTVFLRRVCRCWR